MNTDDKARGTMDRLGKVAPNLYRDQETNEYYGRKKVAGRRKIHKLGTTDRKLADRRLSVWMSTLGKINVDAAKMTLMQLIDLFKKSRLGKKEKTRENEEWILGRIELGFDTTRRACLIGATELTTFLANEAAKGISDRTYNYFALVLGQLFRIAEREGVVAESPYKLAKIKWKRISRRRPMLPTLEQFEEIITEIRANKFNDHATDAGDFVEFLGRAALGQAEAWNLRGRDMDFEAGEMQIRRVKTGKYFTVPIYPKLRPLLKRMADDAGGTFPADERVFKIKDAKLAINGAIKRINEKRKTAAAKVGKRKKVAKAADELPHFSQRNFRQMAIKHLVRKGVDVQLISEWQAHGDGGKLILNTYSQGFDSGDADYRREQLAKVA